MDLKSQEKDIRAQDDHKSIASVHVMTTGSMQQDCP